MKTKKAIITLIFVLISSFIYTQTDTLIVLKSGKSIKVDGVINKNEWTDSDSLFTEIEPNWISTVYYKHDSSHVLFAFKHLEKATGSRAHIDLLIDKLNNKSATWDSNDLWLHASYNDCEAIGSYDVWGNTCTKTKPDWLANNFDFVNGNDNIEMQINFSKFDLKVSPDTLGFGICLGYNEVNYSWPGTVDINKPFTWGYLVFPKIENTGISYVKKNDKLFIFPNPSSGLFTIKFKEIPLKSSSIEIYNAIGKAVLKKDILNSDNITIDLTNHPVGMYLIKIIADGISYEDKILKIQIDNYQIK